VPAGDAAFFREFDPNADFEPGNFVSSFNERTVSFPARRNRAPRTGTPTRPVGSRFHRRTFGAASMLRSISTTALPQRP